MAMLIAYVIGIIIFIDGLLSIMFTGVVTRQIGRASCRERV